MFNFDAVEDNFAVTYVEDIGGNAAVDFCSESSVPCGELSFHDSSMVLSLFAARGTLCWLSFSCARQL